VDETLLDFAEVNAHPLINSATTRVATEDLLKFMKACGHTPVILPLG
jgi:Ala-tRNA(Pro) deacylase